MNWTDHPTLYQVLHPFHWLTYGQNASGVQTLVAIVATIAACFAGYFAGRAYLAALDQVHIAKAQLELERRRYEEEKIAAYNLALAEYQRRVAEEDAIRPRFQTGSYSGGFSSLTFTNIGSSPALDVSFHDPITDRELSRTEVIPAGKARTLSVDTDAMQVSGIRIRFRTSFGSHWQILQWIPTAQNPNSERVIEITSIYTPPTPVTQSEPPPTSAAEQ